MSDKWVDRIALYRGYDLNRDGVEDLVMYEAGGESFEGKDAKGNKITGYLDYYLHRPYLEGGSNKAIYYPFKQDMKCDVKGRMVWLYDRPQPLIFNGARTKFFQSGQKVLVNGQPANIRGLSVMITPDGGDLTMSPPVIVLTDCRKVTLDDISAVTPTGDRLDMERVMRAARCTTRATRRGCNRANTDLSAAERSAVKLLTDARHKFGKKIPGNKDLEEYLEETSIGKEWELSAILMEGLRQYLATR